MPLHQQSFICHLVVFTGGSFLMFNTCVTIFLISKSICRQSVESKCCSYIVLKVFDGLRHLIHILTTKAGSLNVSLL
jgi:hypothetical protein